jgi:hypothetical protein
MCMKGGGIIDLTLALPCRPTFASHPPSNPMPLVAQISPSRGLNRSILGNIWQSALSYGVVPSCLHWYVPVYPAPHHTVCSPCLASSHNSTTPSPSCINVPQQVVEATTGLKQMAISLRDQIPILHQEINSRPLVYLDNAATSQKPLQVIQAMDEYYREYNSNVHRGVHALSARATSAYEEARAKIARFVNAASHREIVFTRNASEAINLVAYSWGMAELKPGDEVGVWVVGW